MTPYCTSGSRLNSSPKVPTASPPQRGRTCLILLPLLQFNINIIQF